MKTTQTIKSGTCTIKRWTLFAMLSVLLFGDCYGQQHIRKPASESSDTLAMYAQFIAVSNGYKQSPMHLDLEIKNSSNFVTTTDDTLAIRAEFYITDKDSYVHAGEYEQVVSDSSALLVNGHLHQMILYKDAAPMIKKMRNMMGIGLQDSSLPAIVKTFKISTQPNGKRTSLELNARDVIYGSQLPKVTIELIYNPQNSLPVQISTTRRTLIRIDSLQYSILKKETGFSGNLVQVKAGYFVIKEHTASYSFRNIDKSWVSDIPVRVTDRIVRKDNDKYQPVKAYAGYRLSVI